MLKTNLCCGCRLGVGLTIGLILTACGTWQPQEGLIRDRSQDYELATAGERLRLPENIQARETSDLLEVPSANEIPATSTREFSVPRPEFFYVDVDSEAVNIARIEGERVIRVDQDMARVWEDVIAFLGKNAIVVEMTDAEKGVIESEWVLSDDEQLGIVERLFNRLVLIRNQGPSADKLRVNLKPDPDNLQRTSIRLQHVRFAQSALPEEIDWQNAVPDVAYQSDIMFELLRFLSQRETLGRTTTLLSLQQQPIAISEIGRDARGMVALRLRASSEESWSWIDRALSSAAVDVGTKTPEAGIFYLTYSSLLPPGGFPKKTEVDENSEEGGISLKVIGQALGFGESNAGQEVSYTSPSNTIDSAEDSEIDTNTEDASDGDGYKIWLGDRVIYQFGGDGGRVTGEQSGRVLTAPYQLRLRQAGAHVIATLWTPELEPADERIAEDFFYNLRYHLSQ